MRVNWFICEVYFVMEVYFVSKFFSCSDSGTKRGLFGVWFFDVGVCVCVVEVVLKVLRGELSYGCVDEVGEFLSES